MNRLADHNPNPTKIVVVQTPMGVVKLELPSDFAGTDPVATALGTFKEAVESGSDDPLTDTLNRLKTLAEEGVHQPLTVGLLILKQMADGGMLPPMSTLIKGTGVTQADLDRALSLVPGARQGLLERLDTDFLN